MPTIISVMFLDLGSTRGDIDGSLEMTIVGKVDCDSFTILLFSIILPLAGTPMIIASTMHSRRRSLGLMKNL